MQITSTTHTQGTPTAPIDATTIATESWNPFEQRFTEPIRLAEPRKPLGTPNLPDAITAASLLANPDGIGSTIAVFATRNGFEAARAERVRWGGSQPGYQDFRVNDHGAESDPESRSRDLVALVDSNRWTKFGADHHGQQFPVLGADATPEATIRLHGVAIPLVMGADERPFEHWLGLGTNVDQAIEKAKEATKGMRNEGVRGMRGGAIAISRGADGELLGRELSSRERGLKYGEWFHFEGLDKYVTLDHVDDPNLVAIVDGDSVIRP